MENTIKLLTLGFYASLFAASISLIIYMYTQIETLQDYIDNHIVTKSVLEERLIE